MQIRQTYIKRNIIITSKSSQGKLARADILPFTRADFVSNLVNISTDNNNRIGIRYGCRCRSVYVNLNPKTIPR